MCDKDLNRRLSQAIWLGQHRLSDLTNLQYEVKELESMKLSDSAGLAKRQCLWSPPTPLLISQNQTQTQMTHVNNIQGWDGTRLPVHAETVHNQCKRAGLPEGAANGLSGSSCHLADPVAHQIHFPEHSL
jgi:hypothetical protein